MTTNAQPAIAIFKFELVFANKISKPPPKHSNILDRRSRPELALSTMTTRVDTSPTIQRRSSRLATCNVKPRITVKMANLGNNNTLHLRDFLLNRKLHDRRSMVIFLHDTRFLTVRKQPHELSGTQVSGESLLHSSLRIGINAGD